jgi:signal transduction histidine kinase
VDEAIGNVRQMSQLLRPTILDDFGLEAGLRWLVEGFSARTGIDAAWNRTSGPPADETETHLFRIAQEALTNVARHAAAKRVTVQADRPVSGRDPAQPCRTTAAASEPPPGPRAADLAAAWA